MYFKNKLKYLKRSDHVIVMKKIVRQNITFLQIFSAMWWNVNSVLPLA